MREWVGGREEETAALVLCYQVIVWRYYKTEPVFLDGMPQSSIPCETQIGFIDCPVDFNSAMLIFDICDSLPLNFPFQEWKPVL